MHCCQPQPTLFPTLPPSLVLQAILGSLSTSQRPAVCRFAEVQGQTLLLRACMAGCAGIVRMASRSGS